MGPAVRSIFSMLNWPEAAMAALTAVWMVVVRVVSAAEHAALVVQSIELQMVGPEPVGHEVGQQIEAPSNPLRQGG